MPLPIRDSQLIDQLAAVLYDFLPGKPFGNSQISFPGAAKAARLNAVWSGGSKRPSLVLMLSDALEHERQRFCPFIVECVRRAISYRAAKSPLTREEVERINSILAKIGFQIPELVANDFLSSLPGATVPSNNSADASVLVEQAPSHRVPSSGELLERLTALEACLRESGEWLLNSSWRNCSRRTDLRRGARLVCEVNKSTVVSPSKGRCTSLKRSGMLNERGTESSPRSMIK